MEKLKKVGAVLGAAVVVGSAGLAGVKMNESNQLAKDLADLQAKVSSGELVPADQVDLAVNEALSKVDLTVDNDQAIVEAMKNLADSTEGLEFDEESGKVVLVSPPAVSEDIEDLENSFVLNELSFGDSIDVEVDSADLPKLVNQKVSFNDEDIEVEEVVRLSDGAKIGFSGSSEFSKSLGALPQLVLLNRNSLEDGIVIKDDLDLDAISYDKPLELPFLDGKTLNIVSLEDGQMTVRAGEELLLNAGEEREINGKSVKINMIGDDAIGVSVDGQSTVAKKGVEKNVNGLKVLVLETFPGQNPTEDGMVQAIIGDDAYKTVRTGDGFDNDDESEADWTWVVSPDFIGVKYNKILNEDGEALKPGDELVTPGGVKVKIKHKEESKSSLDLSFDEVEVNDVLTDVLALRTDDSFEFLMDGKKERSNRVFFDCNKFYSADGNLLKEITDLSLRKTGDVIDDSLTLRGLDVDVDCSEQKFTKLELNGLDLSNRDEDTLGQDGLVVKGVEDLDDAEELNLLVPRRSEKVDLVLE